MVKSINKVMSVAVSVGVEMDTKEASRQGNMFARELGLARAATRDLTDVLKVFKAVAAEAGVTSEQAAIVEARLTLAHERRTAKINAEIAAVNQLKAANAALAAQAKSDVLGVLGYSGTAGSGQSFVPGMGGPTRAVDMSGGLGVAGGGTNRASGGPSMADAAAMRAADDARFAADEARLLQQQQQSAAARRRARIEASQRQAADDAIFAADEARRLAAQQATEASLRAARRRTRIEAAQRQAADDAIFAADEARIQSQQQAAEAARRAARRRTMIEASQRQAADDAIFAADEARADAARIAGETTARTARRRTMIEASQRQADLAEQGSQYMAQFDTTQERVNRQVAEARRLFDAGALSQEQYAKATTAINRQNSLAYQSFQQMKTAITTLLGPLVIAVSAYQAFTSSIKAAADLDAARAKFKVFTGSIREAEQALKDIRALAASSPVSFAGAQRATTTMLQFGVSDSSVIENLRQIAEITGGDTERMESLALAFGQASAAGRLMGQELLQMVNAGFNPLKVISDQTGRSMKDLKDAMSAGEISFEMVAKAFADAVGPGGQFNGLLKEMADTTAGKLTQANSAVQELQIAFGEFLEPVTEGVLDEFIASVRDLAAAFELLKAAKEGISFGITAGLEISNPTRSGGSQGFGEGVNLGAALSFDMAESEKALADAKRFEEEIRKLKQVLANQDSIFKVTQDPAELERLKEIVEQFDKIALLRKKVEDGTATDQEKDFVGKADAVEADKLRNTDNVTDAELVKATEDYRKAAAAAKDLNEQNELWVKYVEEVGQKRFTDEQIEAYKKLKAEIEAATKAEKERERISKAFEDGKKSAEKDLMKSRYGDKAGIVGLLQEQATGDERRILNNMIAAGAAYDDIVLAANDEAQAQAGVLETLLEKNKALEDTKTKEKEAAEAAKNAAKERAKELEEARKKFESDQFELEKQAKAIRDLQNPYSELIDKLATAALLNSQGLLSDGELKAERNRLAGDAVKNVTATAVPTFSRNSQEAYQFSTGQTVDKITRQLQQLEKQTILAQTAVQVAEETNRKLDELLEAKPQVLGP